MQVPKDAETQNTTQLMAALINSKRWEDSMNKPTTRLPHTRSMPKQPPPYPLPAVLGPMTGPAPAGLAFIEPAERQGMIAEAAYLRAERRGFDPGHEVEDWLAAEQDIERLLPSPCTPRQAGG